ncbi:hypothetical protein StoSoilA2_37890 [Arthrobacter sp. StoSoilA2]|nr:hypothetical protein StoSoilA2_37890 [Arthrobacter sp. StoSoilA2]
METLIAMEEDLQDANADQREAGRSREYLAQQIHAVLLANPAISASLRAGYASGAKTFKGGGKRGPLPMPARTEPRPYSRNKRIRLR